MVQAMAKKTEHLDQHAEMTLMKHQGFPAKQRTEVNHSVLGYLKRTDTRSSQPGPSNSQPLTEYQPTLQWEDGPIELKL